jgi:predicted 3-demethylubiquinone-9 3-methyltransferase (glyoxalase superfamily)
MPAFQKITPRLWTAEEVAHFYVFVFKNARISKISHYSEKG